MVIPADEQSKRTMCIALYNRKLHANSICPGNHSVDYSRGWFTFDDEPPFHMPEITQEADRLLSSEDVPTVYYSPVWNTFVLA